MQNLWQELPKPIIALAPMDGVTDAAMRYITATHGGPDAIFTEFTHVQGLWLGKLVVYKDLLFDEIERPIIAQIFGSEPEYFYKAAHICCELGFDGIDINMGCPANSIIKKGGGAALIKTPELAKTIIFQTKRGVRDWANGSTLEDIGLNKEKISYIRSSRRLAASQAIGSRASSPPRRLIPVSVKTRTGFDKVIIKEWVSHLLETNPALITIHGRTLSQLYRGKADWETLGSISDMIHDSGTLYFGNGDIQDRQEGEKKAKQYNMDGVMIGQAAMGNPWVFLNNNGHPKNSLGRINTIPSIYKNDSNSTISNHIIKQQKLKVALEHAQLHHKIFGDKKFPAIKKHLGWYCKGFNGAKELRIELMGCQSLEQVEKNLSKYIS